jgi:hypothetical protein
LLREDLRFDELDDVMGASLEGPAESLNGLSATERESMKMLTYLGLDITACILPFFPRLEADGRRSGSDTFCLFVRLVGAAFAGSGSRSGLVSRAGAFRFRDEGGGWLDEAATGPAAVADEPDDDSEELAACLAAERVILEDMSIGSVE